MDTDSPQAEANSMIEANLGENGGHVAFASIKEAKAWVERETRAWERFWTGLQLGNQAGIVRERQLELPTKIRDSLNDAEQTAPGDQPQALRRIEELFGRYADYGSLCSRSRFGEFLLAGHPSHFPLEKLGGLASILGIPAEEFLEFSQANHQRLPRILSGYTIGRMRNVVKRSDIADFQGRLDEQLAKMVALVAQTEVEREEVSKRARAACDEIDRQQTTREEQWAEFHSSTEMTWEGLRTTFEEQLHVQAPATYWQERADKTSAEARRSLKIFVGIAVLFILAVVTVGPPLLGRLAEVEQIGSFSVLAMLSFPALTGLWILRHFARLFVTSHESSTDAKLRQTMTTTFLALTKEGAGSVSKEERLLVLQALFRAPPPNKGDDGHLGALLGDRQEGKLGAADEDQRRRTCSCRRRSQSARNRRDDSPHQPDEIAWSEPNLEAPSAGAHVNALEPECALVDDEGKPRSLVVSERVAPGIGASLEVSRTAERLQNRCARVFGEPPAHSSGGAQCPAVPVHESIPPVGRLRASAAHPPLARLRTCAGLLYALPARVLTFSPRPPLLPHTVALQCTGRQASVSLRRIRR